MPALATTTLGAALPADAGTVALASGTGVSKGTLLFTGHEALSVTGQVTATVFKVQRGAAATTAAAHPVDAVVYVGAPTQFYGDDPQGVPEAYPPVTPWINTVNGTVWIVVGDAWEVDNPNGAFSGASLSVTGAVDAGTDVAAANDITAGGDVVVTGDVKAATYHVGATAGDDSGGALTSITSITVVKGIVTDIQGT